MQAQAIVIIDGKCVYLGDNLHVTLGVAGGVALLLLQLLITFPYRCCQNFPSDSPAAIKENSAIKFFVGSW